MRRLLPLLLAAPLAFGCSVEIGDECTANVDCSTTGDRVCDLSVPDGYCTILGCRAGDCPEEALCVAWGTGVEERTFCMRDCTSGDDCRDGYQCFEPLAYAALHSGEPDFDPTDFGVILDPGWEAAGFCEVTW